MVHKLRLLRRSLAALAGLVIAGAQANPAVAPSPLPSAQPPASPASAPTPGASDATDRAALLQKLSAVKAQLAELQQNVQTLAKLTQEPDAAATQTAEPSPPKKQPFWTLELLWLSVVAIIAVMFGVSYSRRPSPSAPAKAPSSPNEQDAATAFQTRLGGLNLDLSADAPPVHSANRQASGTKDPQP